MMGCCGVLCLKGLHSSAWAPVICQAVKECVQNKRNLFHNWLKQSFSPITDLSFGHLTEVMAGALNLNDSECVLAFAPSSQNES